MKENLYMIVVKTKLIVLSNNKKENLAVKFYYFHRIIF